MGGTLAVTGASGFVGGRVVRALAARGWTVYAVTSRPDRVPETGSVIPVSCEWTAEGARRALDSAGDASHWVHAGARVDLSGRDPMSLYLGNALLTEALASGLRGRPGVALIYLSSVSVYGPDQAVSLEVEPAPVSHYGISKLLGERSCSDHLGRRCLVLRLAGVWGREDDPKLFINCCLFRALRGEPLDLSGPGTGLRNYLWVGDLTSVIDAACGRRWYGAHLAASHESLSVQDMVAVIADRLAVPIIRRESDATERDLVVPPSLDFPTTGFREALDVEIGAAR